MSFGVGKLWFNQPIPLPGNNLFDTFKKNCLGPVLVRPMKGGGLFSDYPTCTSQSWPSLVSYKVSIHKILLSAVDWCNCGRFHRIPSAWYWSAARERHGTTMDKPLQWWRKGRDDSPRCMSRVTRQQMDQHKVYKSQQPVEEKSVSSWSREEDWQTLNKKFQRAVKLIVCVCRVVKFSKENCFK
mgnify:CR=1 FL=1